MRTGKAMRALDTAEQVNKAQTRIKDVSILADMFL